MTRGTRSKREWFEAIRSELEAQLEALRESARATAAGATHAEARPENAKDTRALEQSYLARGQAARVEALEESATRLRFFALRSLRGEPIEPGALVCFEVDGEQSPWRALLLPVGGGLRVRAGGEEIRAVTPEAPFGRALVGRREGEDFELRIGGRLREYVIVEIE